MWGRLVSMWPSSYHRIMQDTQNFKNLRYVGKFNTKFSPLIKIMYYFSKIVPSQSCLHNYRFHANYTFFHLGKFLKKLADDQCSSITKGSIFYIKHMYIQPKTMGVDWPEITCLMEVSIMFYMCTYCVFAWYGRRILMCRGLGLSFIIGMTGRTEVWLVVVWRKLIVS